MKKDKYLTTCQGKFDLKNVVINIVAGLGLLSFISMFCDFILLNYVNERFLVRKYSENIYEIFRSLPRCSVTLLLLFKVKEKKFEVVNGGLCFGNESGGVNPSSINLQDYGSD